MKSLQRLAPCCTLNFCFIQKEPVVAVHVIAASDNMQIIPSETSPDIDQGLCELQDDLPDETNSTSSVTKGR